MPLHPTLQRQLRRLSLDLDRLPTQQQWSDLLARVSRSYGDGDQDRYTLERSIDCSGAEMRELYADLSREHETLLTNRHRTRAIFEHSAVGQALIDAQGRCTEANHALAIMLGWDTNELLGRQLFEALVPGDRATFTGPLRELLAGERLQLAAEQQWQTKERGALWVNVTLSLVQSTGSQPRFAAVFVQDIHERKRLEVELRHAQKLESVGRLAAGIAHEINTPVQFVGDNVLFFADAAAAWRQLRARYRALLAQAVGAGSVRAADIASAEQEADIDYVDQEVPRAVAQTLDGVQRVATIVRALKEFAHPGSNSPMLADLNHALASTITVARNELKYVADVETDFGEIPEVKCHIGDLNQAFLNILVNAAHAIADAVPSGGRGTIRVSTACRDDHVLVRISDTGGGIPEDIREHIFEPFFTTKEVGRGTGQGLALAHSVVVDRHRGQLSFTSIMGEGTTFEIRLPTQPAAALGLARSSATHVAAAPRYEVQ